METFAALAQGPECITQICNPMAVTLVQSAQQWFANVTILDTQKSTMMIFVTTALTVTH